ncbi:MAG: hypothetical protein PVH73_03360 [Candidatus Bathyarchaeota archaeon]
MTSKIIEKPEKIVGYVLLAVGLVVVIIPVCFGVSVLLWGRSAIPKILETPVLSLSDTEIPVDNQTVVLPISEANINAVIERTFPAVNLCLFFVVAVVLISAGSVLMGKGVSLIKEAKLRVVREQTGEETEAEEKKEANEKER